MPRVLACTVLALLLSVPALRAEPLVVYSERKEPLFQPILEAYTRATGIEVQVLTDQAQVLIERLAAEGERTRADVLVTVDAGNLWQATERGVLGDTRTPALDAAVPAAFRDPDGRWYAITERARVIVHAPERVPASELSTYEDLADPRWRGRLCLRSSKKVYNQSLVAMLIDRHGEARAEAIVAGWVANLAAPPFADDTLVIEAIAAGQCDVGVVNTYYYGRLAKQRPDLAAAVFYPNQGEGEGGVHVNVTGAGVVAHSRQPEQARAFIEWLLTEPAQRLFADIDFEFPVNPAVPANDAVAAWGTFKADPRNIAQAGRLQAAAVRLMDRAGYR
jgi:iron(III) transport system substrate-binding protein